jgi:hypothetical protein
MQVPRIMSPVKGFLDEAMVIAFLKEEKSE